MRTPKARRSLGRKSHNPRSCVSCSEPDRSLIEARARRLIERGGGERRLIPILLENAWLLTQPTCPEVDEPVAEQKARTERARRIAVTALRLIYRDQLARGDVDDSIRQFFAEQMELQVWSAAGDPIAAFDEFLGRPKRGAPVKTAARNFDLAADIQELVDQDIPVDAACHAVAKSLLAAGQTLAPETLHDIYFREINSPVNKRAVKAMLITRAISELEALRRKNEQAEGLDPADGRRFAQLEARIAEYFLARSRGSV